MQDAMRFFLSDCSNESMDIDHQQDVIHMIRCDATATLRSLSNAARVLMDDDTFKDRVDADVSDLTMLAAKCPGAGSRSDMLIMLTEKIEHAQQLWWTAEWEFTNGLKKEMKAKWDELHRMRVSCEKVDQGEFRNAAVATGVDWVAASAHAYPHVTPTKFKDRSRSPPSRARAHGKGLDFSDALDPNPLSDDDSQKTLPLRGPRGSDSDSVN